MPYIKQERRIELFDIDALGEGSNAQSTGELNYLITHLINSYILYNAVSYKTINDVIGALECAKLEFYRRVAVPYEETKKAENGDVYL